MAGIGECCPAPFPLGSPWGCGFGSAPALLQLPPGSCSSSSTGRARGGRVGAKHRCRSSGTEAVPSLTGAAMSSKSQAVFADSGQAASLSTSCTRQHLSSLLQNPEVTGLEPEPCVWWWCLFTRLGRGTQTAETLSIFHPLDLTSLLHLPCFGSLLQPSRP